MAAAELNVTSPMDRRIPLPFLLVPFGAVALVAMVADWIWPTLVTNHPLVLLAMSPKNRFLLLTAPQLDATAFFVVGFVRLVLTDPITYVVGRQYGEQALEWMDGRSGAEPGQNLVRKAERLFSKAAPVFIVVAPSALWCTLAGVGGMRVATFVTCNVAGTVGRLLLFWFAADALAEPLDSVISAIEGAQGPLLAITVTLGLAHLGYRRIRHGRRAVLPVPPVVIAPELAGPAELRD